MSLITWACLRCVQELTTILGPQNRTQGSCVVNGEHKTKQKIKIGPKKFKFTIFFTVSDLLVLLLHD